MRLGTMGIAAAVSAAVVVMTGLGTALTVIRKDKPSSPTVQPAGPGVVAAADSPTPPPPAPLTHGGNQAVRFYLEDQGAVDFLSLSIRCGPASVSMFDFLSMRAIQYRSVLNQTYSISSEFDGSRTVISVVERTGAFERNDPGFPTEAVFRYVLDGSSAEFIGTSPEYVVSEDPARFMRGHRDAVCNGLWGLGLVKFPTALEPYPTQPTDNEKRARFASILSRAPTKRLAAAQADTTSPPGQIIYAPETRQPPAAPAAEESVAADAPMVGSPEQIESAADAADRLAYTGQRP